jgi:hypothetical protein
MLKQSKSDSSKSIKARVLSTLTAAAAASNEAAIKRYLTVKTVTRQHLDVVASRRLQNALIDFMSVNACAITEIVAELVNYDFFTDSNKAIARYERHDARDFNDCIVERSKRTYELLASTVITETERFAKR